MNGLTHGSDLRLAPTIRPIADELGGSPRRAISKVAEMGFTAIQLDATMPRLRPRELDTSARRDLIATVVRSGLSLAGLDFFIPIDHYGDSAHLDRAADAAIAACSLASDLGRVPLTLNLPTSDADKHLVHSLLSSADALGVPLVICHAQAPDQLLRWLSNHDSVELSIGLDPATLLISRIDPVQSAQELAANLGVARLSDAIRGQADSRATIGQADLDVLAYRVSVDLAAPKHGPIVLDLRSLANPLSAATSARQVWQRAVM